jgi:hypothetical protein
LAHRVLTQMWDTQLTIVIGVTVFFTLRSTIFAKK